jgi:hypothetical protein
LWKGRYGREGEGKEREGKGLEREGEGKEKEGGEG